MLKKKKIAWFCKNQPIIMQMTNLQADTLSQDYADLKMTAEQHIKSAFHSHLNKTMLLEKEHQR